MVGLMNKKENLRITNKKNIKHLPFYNTISNKVIAGEYIFNNNYHLIMNINKPFSNNQ